MFHSMRSIPTAGYSWFLGKSYTNFLCFCDFSLAGHIPDKRWNLPAAVLEVHLLQIQFLRKLLSQQVPADQKFAFEDRNGLIIRQYATVLLPGIAGLMVWWRGGCIIVLRCLFLVYSLGKQSADLTCFPIAFSANTG
jgi:hypothetical protein